VHFGILQASLGKISSILGIFYEVEFKFNSVTFSKLTSILLEFKNDQIAKIPKIQKQEEEKKAEEQKRDQD
jgi:hypothetical protein